MIYELSRELETALQAKGVPFRVVYGPERTESTTFGDERIVLEEPDGGDTFGPARSQHKNPKSRFTTNVGALLRIYARSPRVGAAVQDHRRRARDVLDRVLVSLDDVIRGTRKSGWTLGSGGFAQLEDLEESESWGGALYELRFTVERSVDVLTWPTVAAPDGEARPQAALGATRSTTSVSIVGAPDGAIPETACGG